MIQEKTVYFVECAKCRLTISNFYDKRELQKAIDWIGWIEEGENHYCPDCKSKTGKENKEQ